MLKSTILYVLITLSFGTRYESPFYDEGIISFDGDQGIQISADTNRYTEYTCVDQLGCSREGSDNTTYYGPFDNDDKYFLSRNIECTENSRISIEYNVAICNGDADRELTIAYVNNAPSSKLIFPETTDSTLTDEALSDVCSEFDVHRVQFDPINTAVIATGVRVPITIKLKLNDNGEVAFIYDIKYWCSATDDTVTVRERVGAYTHDEYCAKLSGSEIAEFILSLNSDEDPILKNGNWLFKQDDLNDEKYLYEVQDAVTSKYRWVFSTALSDDTIISQCTESTVKEDPLSLNIPCSSAVQYMWKGECQGMHPVIISIVETGMININNISDQTQIIGLLIVFCLFNCVMGMVILYVFQLFCCKDKTKKYTKLITKDVQNADDIDDIDF